MGNVLLKEKVMFYWKERLELFSFSFHSVAGGFPGRMSCKGVFIVIQSALEYEVIATPVRLCTFIFSGEEEV